MILDMTKTQNRLENRLKMTNLPHFLVVFLFKTSCVLVARAEETGTDII